MIRFRDARPSATEGYSLPELIITVAVIGILAAIAIANFPGARNSAQETVAETQLSELNRALLHFNQCNWDIVLDAVSNAGDDELKVLRTLQWRNPDSAQATPGSPYLPSTFCDAVSSSASDYRIQWNGHMFELLEPGTSGTGLKTGTDSPSVSGYTYPTGYQPLGASQHE